MSRHELLADASGSRLDAFVASRMEEISRSRIESLIKSDSIIVNGKPVSKSYRIQEGDHIVIELPTPVDAIPQAKEMDLEIVYEDEHLLVINKPKGVVVHPAPGHYDDTLVNGLLAHCRGDLSGINGEKRPGIVHRIDKDTSGLLVIAKNDRAHQGLSEQFERHSIDRRYQAIVYGTVSPEEGTVDAGIGRCLKDRKKMAIGVRNTKRAVTHYKVLRQFRGFAHIECQLETGRTHQIRVHMSSIGHFVLGDMVYGRPSPNLKLEFEGQCLHAKSLGFIHPITGEHLLFDSELPDYFKKIIEKLNRMV